MNFKLALGTGVAIVAVYCVLVIGIVRKTALYEHYHRHVGIAICTVGATFLVVGYGKRRRTAQQPVTEDGEALENAPESANATQHVSLLDALYVGLMSVMLGVATVFILPIQSTPETVPVRATEPTPRPLAKPVPTNAPPPVVQPVKPVTFPAVRVQGIYFRPERPSALINRKTYFIGDQVQDAKVVAITRDTVVLEIEGQQRAYPLEK